MTSSTKPLVVIAAGGAGGHMFPAQAFADESGARGWMIALVTDERGKKYATNFPADWRLEVDAATFGSKLPHKLLASALKLRKGTAEARKNSREDQAVADRGLWRLSLLSLAVGGAGDGPADHRSRAELRALAASNRLFVKSAKYVACGFRPARSLAARG